MSANSDVKQCEGDTACRGGVPYRETDRQGGACAMTHQDSHGCLVAFRHFKFFLIFFVGRASLVAMWWARAVSSEARVHEVQSELLFSRHRLVP